MKALVYTNTNEVTFESQIKPTPAEGEVLVQVEKAGICGSDMHAYHGHDPRRVPPLILGHEACGIAMNGKYLGKRVVLNPLLTCMQCEDCLSGRTHLCVNRTAIGLKKPGAFAEYTVIPEQNLIPVPEGMKPEHAALTEPTATALHASELIEKHMHRTLSDSRAVVIGAGSIGLLCALFLKLKGVAKVTLSDTNADRLETAKHAGIQYLHNPLTDDPLPDSSIEVVIDAVGSSHTRKAGMNVIKQGGVFLHVGLQDSSGEFDVRKMTLQEITVLGSFSYTQLDMISAIEILHRGALGDLSWIEERPLSQGSQAFSDLDNNRTAAAKIILDINA
ncbi:alcohol dehydrogenase catalytic domain-containing protein [Vibrio nigripulchritudo]|uniref:alcohol dehydrogenase catalytic domain-containing protein n=1 Tax=Vibrio nigripulchritudo TaxID=28173 RepID=UPI00249329B1|nr:alcohol dehydrogenase catalytic domain-containing protein [Vibrio nigripulchritudo]BDU36979.1 galactonate oxidoreductase [Vibrio nigripulchritudo]BDU42689.1 galactonate oxidoreductase [Vibrio nigripulchritudo]